MKQLIYKINISLSLLALSACSSSSPVAPSQNSALTKLSGSHHKSGYLQKSLDSFLQTKWNPTMQKSPEIQKKYGDKKRSFRLQEYVDKYAAYAKEHPSDANNSLVHKMESMPVIGK